MSIIVCVFQQLYYIGISEGVIIFPTYVFTFVHMCIVDKLFLGKVKAPNQLFLSSIVMQSNKNSLNLI